MSIITPLDPGAADFFQDTIRSVVDQDLPAGWELEWLVHVDGGTTPAWLAGLGDNRVRISSHRATLGPAVSRNLLFAKASGEYIKVLGGDDQLPRGAIARDIETVTVHPEISWVTSRVEDLLPDDHVRSSKTSTRPASSRSALYSITG